MTILSESLILNGNYPIFYGGSAFLCISISRIYNFNSLSSMVGFFLFDLMFLGIWEVLWGCIFCIYVRNSITDCTLKDELMYISSFYGHDIWKNIIIDVTFICNIHVFYMSLIYNEFHIHNYKWIITISMTYAISMFF